MVDPLPIRLLKAVVRGAWTLEYAVRRTLQPSRYALAGACGGCAKCCERPSIRTGLFTRRLRRLRSAFVLWQRWVNGFELVEVDQQAQHFVFRCTHFDRGTRRCDSYASRPFLCRDYPRALLDQPWPELFPECGFRPLAKNAEAMLADLERRGIPEEKRGELERRLYLK